MMVLNKSASTCGADCLVGTSMWIFALSTLYSCVSAVGRPVCRLSYYLKRPFQTVRQSGWRWPALLEPCSVAASSPQSPEPRWCTRRLATQPNCCARLTSAVLSWHAPTSTGRCWTSVHPMDVHVVQKYCRVLDCTKCSGHNLGMLSHRNP